MDPRTRPARWLVRRRERPEAPLNVYVFAHAGGSSGRLVGESVGWARHLDLITRRLALPGGHFYFREDCAPLLGVIREVAGEVGVGRWGATSEGPQRQPTRRPRPVS